MKVYPKLLVATIFLAGCVSSSDPEEGKASKTRAALQVAPKEVPVQPSREAVEVAAYGQHPKGQATPCGPCAPKPGNCRQRLAQRLQEAFKNPIASVLRADESFYGPADAPLLLVVYLDFQCHFCVRGEKTVAALRAHFGDKLKVVYRHRPLAFHPQARRAAEYYEAMRRQSADKALRFGRLLLANQPRLKEGEESLLQMARAAGAQMGRLRIDVDSREVKDRIERDLKEARRFGIRGTPTYVLNGIRLVGIRSKAQFIKVVEELVDRRMVTL